MRIVKLKPYRESPISFELALSKISKINMRISISPQKLGKHTETVKLRV